MGDPPWDLVTRQRGEWSVMALYRHAVEDALRDGEFEPAIAASGEEAVMLLGAFRCAITDISLLRQMDGWRVARAAREIDPTFRIIYITGAAGNHWDWKGVPGSILLTNLSDPTN